MKPSEQGGIEMDFRQVILKALGLQGIDLIDVKLFSKELRAEIVVEQQRVGAACSKCSQPLGNLKEWVWKRIKGPPFGVFNQVIIRLHTFRAVCDVCHGNRVCQNDWIHPKHRSVSWGFFETSGRLMEEMSCEAAGRLMGGVHSMQMMRLDQSRLHHMLKDFKIPNVDHSALSADEVHFKTIRIEHRKGLWAKRWDREWITNLVSIEAVKGEDRHRGKILFNAMGRSKAALRDCFKVLSPGQKLAVEWFCSDMHDPFIAAAKKDLPNAKICVDRFHLVQNANKAFDAVRKQEFKRAESQFHKDMLLPSRRFILVSKEKDLSKAEIKQLDRLREENKNIHTAMLLVEYLHTTLDKKGVPAFRKALKNWYQVVRESKLEPFRRFAATIRKYRGLIENYILSRLTTAISEGLNNKIKTLKRMGYGYKLKTYFRHKILQRAGYLNHYHIPTNHLMFGLSTKCQTP